MAIRLLRARSFPEKQAAEPLLEEFPWLPYAGPALMVSACVFAHLCIWVLCRMKPRQWTHEKSRAEWADRYCRTRLLAGLYCLPIMQFVVFTTQPSTMGKLYPHVNDLVRQWPLVLPSLGSLSLFLFIGFLVFVVPHAQSGQLGGRLTGWPWRPRDATTQATA